MRVVVHDYLGHPAQVGLSRELARRGHNVWHLVGAGAPVGQGPVEPTPGDPATLSLRATPTGDGYAGRVAERIARIRPDVVLSGNASPQCQHVVMTRAQDSGAAFVYWAQDLISGYASDSPLWTPMVAWDNSAAKSLARQLEHQALLASDAVVAIAADFTATLRDIGVADSRVHVIENWGPPEIMAAHPRPWPPAERLRRGGEPVILYAGTVDRRHNPDLLAAIARQCARRRRGVLMVVSTRDNAEAVRAAAGSTARDRVHVVDFQPHDVVPDMLAAADLLVVSLTRDAAAMSVPSKVLAYLCAGRPILAAVPADTPVAAVVRRAGAGVVASPDDIADTAHRAHALLDDRPARRAMGRAGRRYAARAFDLGRIATAFESVLQHARGAARVAP